MSNDDFDIIYSENYSFARIGSNKGENIKE